MSLQYIAEGLASGALPDVDAGRAAAQVLRNAASIGIDLHGAIDRAAVRLYYDPPQEIEIDRHFHRIEQIVREFKPRRAVIDSLSTYGSSLGAAGRTFRDFFHAIVALMKEHQVTAIYNHENPEMFGMSSMMGDYGVSSLVDNIILLNWVELGDVLRHAVTVSKMRASPTSHVTLECEIVNGVGMRVLARAIPQAFRRFLRGLLRSPGAFAGATSEQDSRRGFFGWGGWRQGSLSAARGRGAREICRCHPPDRPTVRHRRAFDLWPGASDRPFRALHARLA
jgi:KaiC/GvpD/RAD55 family RecA-like ATPase